VLVLKQIRPKYVINVKYEFLAFNCNYENGYYLNLEMNFSKAKSLEMETEDQYRQKAAGYRSSPEYGKMINLYPILQNSIQDCKDESLVA